MKQLRADEPAVAIVEGGGGAHCQAQEDSRMAMEVSRRFGPTGARTGGRRTPGGEAETQDEAWGSPV